MVKSLNVYLHKHLVGVLTQNEFGEMVFEYIDAWHSNTDATPLSRSLPISKQKYSNKECRGFFAGLLPEQEKRRIIAKNLHVSERNDFSLLEKIGGECAGAVSLLSANQELQKSDSTYHHFSKSQLKKILETLPRHPLMAGEEGVRFSLAGAQDKIAVYVSENEFYLPLYGAPSSHILKPS